MVDVWFNPPISNIIVKPHHPKHDQLYTSYNFIVNTCQSLKARGDHTWPDNGMNHNSLDLPGAKRSGMEEFLIPFTICKNYDNYNYNYNYNSNYNSNYKN